MLRLELLTGSTVERTLEPPGDVIRVGRSKQNDVVMGQDFVLPFHLRLDIVGGQTLVRALSDAESWLERDAGREPLARGSTPLISGDVLILGPPSEGARIRVLLTPEVDEQILAVQPVKELPRDTGSAERNTDLLKQLSELHTRITEAPGLAPAVQEIADSALLLVPRASHVTVILADPDAPSDGPAGYLPAIIRTRDPSSGLPKAPTAADTKVLSVYRRVVRERAAVLAVDAPDAGFHSESLLGADIRSIIGVPLWRGEDIIGVIQVDSRGLPALFDQTDLNALGLLACSATLAIANARLIEKLVAQDKELKTENSFLKRREQARRQDIELVGESRAMRELLQAIDKVASTRVSVLIEGETGTGKELVAARLHGASGRRQRLFVAQNCAALPENLLESELFGHRRGAFTGATEEKKGLFEVADGGTLLLDEVNEIPLNLQAKLLRVLQEGEVRPLGATREKVVDVRIVAACNKSLSEEVRAGRFREDLYYRLSVYPLLVPPLRERREDIPRLARHFLTRFCLEIGKTIAGFNDAAITLLESYPWPGNVRELQNEVQRVAIQAEPNGTIEPALLSPRIRRAESAIARAGSIRGTLKERVEQVERLIVLETLEEHGQNKTNAAKALGITREGLHKKLKLLKIGA